MKNGTTKTEEEAMGGDGLTHSGRKAGQSRFHYGKRGLSFHSLAGANPLEKYCKGLIPKALYNKFFSPGEKKTVNILFLADSWHEANVVQNHINAFSKYSNHNIFVVNPIRQHIERCCKIEKIDIILIHYSILILSDYFLPDHNAKIVKDFCGPKAQIIQDEYRWVNKMKARMKELGIDVVFSSMTPKNMKKVYGDDAVPLANMTFYGCLPGYIPEHLKNIEVLPLAKRRLDIAYRGRNLPYHAGKEAQEKSHIGAQMLRLCGQYGGLIDISSAENMRIYGDDWLNFLASARTTLGVEGGVSIFDFDEQVTQQTTAYLEKNPGASFEEVFEKILKPYEGNVVHRTITPRIFEAICLKTVLILYPGHYNGLLKPDIHYIPYVPDLSDDPKAIAKVAENAADIAEKLKDHDYLQKMADTAYDAIVNKAELQDSFYVGRIDCILENLYYRTMDKTTSRKASSL